MKKRNFPEPSVLLLCCLCTFFWGAGYSVLKISYIHWDIERTDIASKLLFAGIRFTISGVLLFTLASVKNRKLSLPSRSMMPRIATLGLFQTMLQYGFLYVGLANTGAAKSSVLNQFCVFLVVIVTPLFSKNERFTVRKVVGCLLGLAGIAYMNMDGLTFSIDFGDVMVLLSSCCAAVGYLITKTIPAEYDAMMGTSLQQLLSGVVLAIVGLMFGGHIRLVNPAGIASLTFLVMVAAVAYSIWFYLLQRNEASRITVYKFLTPFFGVVISGILLGETVFSLKNSIALFLVCLGVVIVNAAHPRKIAGDRNVGGVIERSGGTKNV